MRYEIAVKRRFKGFCLDCNIKGEASRLGVLGVSGSGKSLTLKSIAGIERPDSGFISLGDNILYDSAKGISLSPQERSCGYIFQNYALFPNMTVRQNIACGLKGEKAEKQRLVDEILERFEIKDIAERYPARLSGGEQQRVALARVIVREPAAILLDEPFSALDVILRRQLMSNIEEYLKDYSGIIIMVSHNSKEIYELCDQVAVIDEGKCIRYGTVQDVFDDPQNERTALLVGRENWD